MLATQRSSPIVTGPATEADVVTTRPAGTSTSGSHAICITAPSDTLTGEQLITVANGPNSQRAGTTKITPSAWRGRSRRSSRAEPSTSR
jgi:hypothetical protein